MTLRWHDLTAIEDDPSLVGFDEAYAPKRKHDKIHEAELLARRRKERGHDRVI